MEKNLSLLAILTIVAVLLIGGCATKTQTEGVIKIGFVAPMTGDVANYGESSRGGADIALEEINGAGGINGNELKLIYEDGQCKGQSASSAANKLINLDKVKIITGTVCSAETLAIAPMAEENKVLLVSVASSSPDITKSGDYIFRVWPSDVFQASKIAEYMYNYEKIKTAAILHPNSDYNLALATAFKKDFEALGGQILTAETYEQDAKDFKTQLTKIKALNPEAIYIVPYGEGGLVTKQIAELGIGARVFASETYGTPEILKDAGDSSEGVIYATPKFDENNPLTKEFLAKYKNKYGKDPSFGVVAACGYDAVKIIANAIKEKGISSDAIKSYLYSVKDYPGVCGTLTIDENGDAIKEFQLMVVRDGKFEKLEE